MISCQKIVLTKTICKCVPFERVQLCRLHNQQITITKLYIYGCLKTLQESGTVQTGFCQLL